MNPEANPRNGAFPVVPSIQELLAGVEAIRDTIAAAILRERPVAVMLVGLSGSGKSTMAKNVLANVEGFVRLSIDADLWRRWGTWGIDYCAKGEKMERLAREAEERVRLRLMMLVMEEKDVVLDMSFHSREARDKYRKLLEDYGEGNYELITVVFRAEEQVLWERIEERRMKWERKREEDLVEEIAEEELRRKIIRARAREVYNERVEDVAEDRKDGRTGDKEPKENVGRKRKRSGEREEPETRARPGFGTHNRKIEGRQIVAKRRGWEGISVSRKVLRAWTKGFEWPGEDENVTIEIEVFKDEEYIERRLRMCSMSKAWA